MIKVIAAALLVMGVLAALEPGGVSTAGDDKGGKPDLTPIPTFVPSATVAPTSGTPKDFGDADDVDPCDTKGTYVTFQKQIGPNKFKVVFANGGTGTLTVDNPKALPGVSDAHCPMSTRAEGDTTPRVGPPIGVLGDTSPPIKYRVGFYPVWFEFGDFNGDGIDDGAVANQDSNNVSILLALPDGTLQAAVNYPAGPGPSSLAVADFNGDGRQDLAVGGNGHVSLLLSNSNGSLRAPVPVATVGVETFLVTGDFNKLGYTDRLCAAPGIGVFLPSGGDVGPALDRLFTTLSPDSVPRP